MEVYIVPRGYWRAIQRGRLVMPAPKGGRYLLVDSVPDGLDNFGVNYISRGVDSHFDHHVASEIMRKPRAIHRRIRIDRWIRDVNLVPSDGAVDHRPEKRSSVGIVLGGVGHGSLKVR